MGEPVEKRTPSEWEQEFGVKITDRRGWDRIDASWDEPIPRLSFDLRMSVSAFTIVDTQRYNANFVRVP